MFCRNCGKEVNEKAVACLGCGVDPLLENIYCPNCGAPTQANQVMCVKCGVSLISAIPVPDDNSIESDTNRNPSVAQKAMRICIGLSWVIGITSIILSFVLQDRLPEGLQAWLNEDFERDMEAYEAVILSISFAAILSWIVASVGLFMLQRWGAILFLISWAVFLILNPFTGPVVEHPLSATLWAIADILTGVVLGLAFFSDALGPKPQRGQQLYRQ